jgi:predicted nuclease of restriction endonuclease-like (RecB) superfamily
MNHEKHESYKEITEEIKSIISQARSLTIRSVNAMQVASNYLIGQRIVEFEQGGSKRAEYGKALLKELSNELISEFGRGYSHRNLDLMKNFYLTYTKKEISQTVSAKLVSDNSIAKSKTLSGIWKPGNNFQNINALKIAQTLSAEFSLSWSHYVFLMTIKNPEERLFYEMESINENWSLQELKRQFNASLYERLALSRDKDDVKKLSQVGHLITKPKDVIKNPYVLEFLGLDEKSKYSESDLETAIIDKLEHFLLELGKGFLFEARQKRFTFDEGHYFVDLVFYNRLLRCYTIIDLKIGEVTHQNLGQMQMYVNYYDRHVKLEDENPTIGIILCKKNNESLVEITLPKDSNIHSSEYQLYLPSKEALKKQLEEAQQEWEACHEK